MISRLCIEASTPRPIQTAHEVFLKHLKALDSPVPLILVYTKMDLFDGSKKVLKSRERFLEDYVSKLLPSSRFELVTTCSGAVTVSMFFIDRLLDQSSDCQIADCP